jgi:hypothetical protein
VTDRILDCLARVRGVLSDAEAGACDPADLLAPLHRLASAFRNCGCVLADHPDYDWCDCAHGLRKVVGDGVVAGGKTLFLALRECRKRLAPLFDILDAARSEEGVAT